MHRAWPLNRIVRLHVNIRRAVETEATELSALAMHAKAHVDADPNAESFYLESGAVRRGVVPAPIPGEPERVRPQLAFNGRAT